MDVYQKMLAFIPGLKEQVEWTHTNHPSGIEALATLVGIQYLYAYYLTHPPVSWTNQLGQVVQMIAHHFARTVLVTSVLLKASPS